MTYALVFISFVFVSETFFPHIPLVYVNDDGTTITHYLPEHVVFDEQGYVRYEIFDLYGW